MSHSSHHWRVLLLALLMSGCSALHSPRTPATSSRMNAETQHWTCRDNKEMPYTEWPHPTATPPLAVLICVHGLSGAASDYWPVGESLPAKGWAVYGLQLRGQGNDPNKSTRGDIRHRSQWIHDLIDFTAQVRQRHPHVPVYWMGESLGSLICLHAAAQAPRPLQPAGLIMTSPVVGFRENLKLPFLKGLVVRTLVRLRPGYRISLENLGNSEVQVTSGTTHRQQMQHTSHYVKDFTLRLFSQIEHMVLHSAAAAASLDIPVLVFYTPHDVLTSRESVERFTQSLHAPGSTKVFFPQSYHLILHDSERARALRKLQQWLQARLRRPR